MKKYSAFFVFCLVLLLASASVFAQGFNGPGVGVQNGSGFNGPTNGAVNGVGTRWQAQAITVNRINSVPHHSFVTLTGNITQSIGRSYYTFRDSTGEMIVEVERKAWGGLTIGPADRVEITGEVEYKRDGSIQVEVKTLRRL